MMKLDNSPKFGNRIAISVLFISGTVFTVFWAPRLLFILCVEAFVLWALYEFFEMAKKKGLAINTGLGLTFAFLFPWIYTSPADVIIMLTAIVTIFMYNFHRRLKEQALVNSSVTMFGIIYVGWFFSHLTKIHELPQGPQWVFFVLSVTKLGDIAAYFMGQRFGHTKLIQHISPNKSIEGAIASILTAIFVALLSKTYLTGVPMRHLLALGTVLGLLAMFGDLCESLIKRDCGVKDSGRIPGLGGVLDVIDSLLFTIPFTYYYVVAFPGVLS